MNFAEFLLEAGVYVHLVLGDARDTGDRAGALIPFAFRGAPPSKCNSQNHRRL